MISEEQTRKYCCEEISNIENYYKAMADKTQIWHCHHRAEILPCGIFSLNDLKKHGLYWNVPASQLVFMTQYEHRLLHTKNRSEETRRKISEAIKGRTMSEEWKRKISEAKRGITKSEETRRKMSEARKGIKLSEEHRRKISVSTSGENNPLFGKHHTDETKKKMSEARKRYLASRRAKQ